jgi:hypothetical protein
MSAEALSRTSSHAQLRTVFAYEVTKEQRTVVRLYGFTGDGQEVRVAAQVYPSADTTDPEWYFSSFSSKELATRFADESLMALEYLGCAVTEPHPEVIQTLLRTIDQAAAG